ncbi:MAG: S-methyl-5-thioribose-1-phosphate isomerase [Omnitrophica WOR_2 bacterium]
MTDYKAIQWVDGAVRLLDQRLLPRQLVYVDYTDAGSLANAIRDMVIRGAPAIGAAAGYGMALAAIHSRAQTADELRQELNQAADLLRASRPTAYDLFGAIDRVMRIANNPELGAVSAIQSAVLEEAQAIANANIEMNRKMGINALPLIPEKANIIHHCNTGSLATVDYGTALGVIRAAYENGKKVFVYVDETRPRLQGARLTAWELQQLGIPHKVIVDGASGHIMRRVGIDLCVVGCDRIAANGDTANKIGTYNLALVAWAHNVPFYVAGPTSTIDMSIASGDEIKIEERPALEVTHVGAEQITPDETPVANPAFDVTPAEYITAIITECGVAYPPYQQSLAEMMKRRDQRL